MASAKREKPVAEVNPADIAKLIPTDDDDSEPTIAHLGDDAPPLLRYEPQPPPPSQSPMQKKRPSATAPERPPVQPRKDIARMLPSSHRVYVYKKKEDGKQVFVNEYTAQELQGAGTIEAFIKKYVVPHYEHGEFHVHYFDGQSKEPTPLGIVNIEAPVDYVPPARANGNGTRQPSMSESMREMMAIQREIAAQQQPPKKSAAEEAMELMMTSMLKKQMEALSSGEQQKDGGMGMMMTMMLMERMKPAHAPTVDPAMQRLMERMMDRIEAMEHEMRVSQAMVPPPPPPVQEGASHMDVIIEAMRENSRMMVEAFKSQQVQRDPIKDLADMAALMAPQKSESLTTRDLFELMPKFQTMFAQKEQQQDPFEKTVQNFRLFKMMQKEFGEDRQPVAAPSEQDSFWSFAKEMIRSDVGKSIAKQILAQANGQDIAHQGRQRAAQQEEQARMVAQRRAEHAMRQRQQAEQRAQQAAEHARAVQAAEQARAAQAQAAAEAPVADPALPATSSAVTLNDATQNVPPPEPVKVPPPPATPPPPEEQEEEGEEEGNEVSVPEGFLTVHAKLINDADNDATRIEAIINGFQILATSQDFRPVITKMFGLCKLNRKAEALDHLFEILEFFSDNEVLRPDLPKQAREGFDKHWKIIRQQMGFEDVPEVAPTQAQA